MLDDEADVVTADSGKKYAVEDGITDAGLKHFSDYYQDRSITKEDLFYYCYGLLHSPDYRQRFGNNLVKDLPRIPRVKRVDDFLAFSKAGRELAGWHLHYEQAEPYAAGYAQGALAVAMMDDADFFVRKMRFPNKADKSEIAYNHHITVTGIPLEAYDYIVNGKSAVEWVMERQGVSTHKDSQITSDANRWATETMGNPKYPLELLLKVVTVSLESMKVVRSLPALDFDAP